MYKILIVDDEKPARELIAGLVASCLPEAAIIKAGHPQQAFERLQTEDFDLLFLDICMPGMTGLNLLKKIRQNGKQPYTVLVSAYRKFDYAVQGIELGVVQYLTKPLYRDKIFETIRQFLQHTDRNSLTVNMPQGMRRIRTEDILAIQTVDRARVKIFTSDGVIPFVTGTLVSLYPFLPACFHYIRRNCIVNEHAITYYNPKVQEVVIVCNNEQVRLRIGREKLKELATRLNVLNEMMEDIRIANPKEQQDIRIANPNEQPDE